DPGQVRVRERIVGLELDELLGGVDRRVEIALFGQRERQAVPGDREAGLGGDGLPVALDGELELALREQAEGLLVEDLGGGFAPTGVSGHGDALLRTRVYSPDHGDQDARSPGTPRARRAARRLASRRGMDRGRSPPLPG